VGTIAEEDVPPAPAPAMIVVRSARQALAAGAGATVVPWQG
jgi:hypothetical protein